MSPRCAPTARSIDGDRVIVRKAGMPQAAMQVWLSIEDRRLSLLRNRPSNNAIALPADAVPMTWPCMPASFWQSA
jgi:hypothetical protein